MIIGLAFIRTVSLGKGGRACKRWNDGAALATQLQELTNAPTKTEAVRSALKNEIERSRAEIPLIERLERIREKARQQFGFPNPDFDQKKFFDEMWEE
jgi:antitoxin VapB